MIDFNLDTTHSILYVHPKSALAAEDFTKLAKAVDPHIEAKGDLAGLIIEVAQFPGWDSVGAFLQRAKSDGVDLVMVAGEVVYEGGSFTRVDRDAALRELHESLQHALADAMVRKTFDEGGMELYPPDQQTPEAAAALVKREIKLWGDVIRANNITVQ